MLSSASGSCPEHRGWTLARRTLEVVTDKTEAQPTIGTPFVGRDRELEELHRGLRDTVAGRGSLVLIGGEPGSERAASPISSCLAHATRTCGS